MKKIIILLAVMVVSVTLNAKQIITNRGDKKLNTKELSNIKTTKLSGVVIDTETGEGLVGVAINIEGSKQVVYTDFDGNFTIENIVPGKYNLQSNYISYTDNKLKNVDIRGVNNVVRIALKRD